MEITADLGASRFVSAWQLLIFRSQNMFTLLGLGVSMASVHSLVATLVSSIFSDSFRGADGLVGDCGLSPCRWSAS